MADILGISAFYHDSAACLVRDGAIVAAAQEERFTRKKHDPGFPSHAVRYCLREGGVSLNDLRYVAFYDKPLVKLAAARDLSGLRAAWHPLVLDGHAGVAQGQALSQETPAEGAAGVCRWAREADAAPVAVR